MDVVKILLPIVEKAGKALAELHSSDIDWHYKAPGELVTEADQISHEIIFEKLTEHFPGVPLVMEEQENPVALPATCIVVDELDGTAIYANGLDQWGISIAFIRDGHPIAGVIQQPKCNVTMVTAIGHGTWLNNKKIDLPPAKPISDCVVGVEINRFQTDDERLWACRIAGRALAIRSLSTVVGSVVELLSGNTALYVNARGAKVWDFAAGVLAVEEAGGIAVNCGGEKLEWSSVPMSAILAANRDLVTEALRMKASSCRD